MTDTMASGSTPELVVVLDESGADIGTMEKLAAHQGDGTLHRAFSVFLFRPDGRMLVHRRASSKHHFRDLWTNSCCSHPRPGETIPAPDDSERLVAERSSSSRPKSPPDRDRGFRRA